MRTFIQAVRYGLLLLAMLCLTACYHSESKSDNPVVSISVAPQSSLSQGVSTPRLALGVQVQYQATVYYQDGSHQVMTDGPQWRSTNDVASVSPSGVVTAHKQGQVEIEATLGSIVGVSPELTITDAVVTAIQLTPATVSLAKGNSQTLTATATYSDQTSADISNSVAWASADTGIATVTTAGLLAGVGVGSTTISASFNGISSNTAAVTVTDAVLTAIQLTPSAVSLAKGNSQTLTATATYSDQTSADISSQVDWVSSDTNIATVTPAGLLAGVGVGSTKVSASFNGISSNKADVTVTDAVVTAIQLTPATVSLAKGNSQTLTATATYSDQTSADISSQVAWVSADTNIATVTPAGLLAGVGVGRTTLSASFNGISSNKADVTVTDAVVTAIQLTPAIVSMAKGYSQTLTATATYSDQTSADISSSVAWVSSDTHIATVTPAGLLAGVGVGRTTLSASLNGISSNSADVTVTDAVVTAIQLTPATVSLAKGNSQTLTAMATYSDQTSEDISSQVAWVSADTAIATVTPSGVLAGVGVGSTKVSASFNGISSNKADVTVTDAVITAIQLTPATVSLAKGNSQTLTATATYSDQTSADISNSVAWVSSDTNIATVTPSGVLAGVGVGSTKVSASFNGISSNTADVTVTDAVVTAIQLTPATVSLAKGNSQTLTVTATYSDQTSADISSQVAWVSADTAIATVTPSGVLAAVGVGSTKVSASFNGISSNTADVAVTDAVVAAVQITPAAVSFGRGASETLTAMASYSDGTQANITALASWGSADAATATVTASGVVTGVVVGSTNVTATFDGVTSSPVPVTVTAAGTVVSWGLASSGGNSSLVQEMLTQVQSIVGSWGAFAALKADGSVVTWGDPARGGDSSAVQSQLTGVTSIVSTEYAFAAIKADGTVVTWGDALYGGDSSTVQGQLTQVLRIAGSSRAFAAVKADGTVVTWGSADAGADSSTVQSQLTGVTSITGNWYSFAALKADGSVVTWGDSRWGGDSSAVQSQLTQVQCIASSGIAFAALKGDGTVVTWGEDSRGGNSSAVQSQLTQITTIVGSGAAFAALKADGTVVTWGYATYGGDSSTVHSQLTGVTSMAGTEWAFAALRGDGTVVTWGDLARGGDSGAVQGQLTQVASIASTKNAFAALKSDGSVVTWGEWGAGGDSSAVQSQLTQVQSIKGTWFAFAAVIGPP